MKQSLVEWDWNGKVNLRALQRLNDAWTCSFENLIDVLEGEYCQRHHADEK